MEGSAGTARTVRSVAPPFKIVSVENTGPTDNSGDDSLWVVWISEPGREAERFLFTRAARFGVPSGAAMRKLIEWRADPFENDRGAIEQFREREIAHPLDHPTRRAIVLRAD
jgi:hypothetical protein